MHSSARDGQLVFYDLMLAWVRIVSSKYLLNPGVLLGGGINQFAERYDFHFSAAPLSDIFSQNIDLIVDYNNLPFPDEEFDFVVSTGLLQPGSKLSCLHEVSRVLAYGGYAMIFNLSPYSILSLQKIYAKGLPDFPELHTNTSIKSQMQRLGLDVAEEKHIAYRPILPKNKFDDLLYLELLGVTLFPMMSSCSYILFKKDGGAFDFSLGGIQLEVGDNLYRWCL